MKKGCLLVVSLALGSALAVPPAWAQQSDGSKIALLIGNANYPDAESPLKQPVADARALGDELRRNGFDVDIGDNLTKEAMQRAFTRLYGKIKPGSAVVVFFGGYGIQTGRQTYLIPVNAQIWTESEVRRDGIGIDMVLAEMNARGANVKIAILDASRRNPFERRFRGVSTGLAPVTAPRGTLVISAAAPGTVVNDGDGDNSTFVRELLKEMRSPGLTVDEILNRTRIGVSRLSKGEQVPWISSSLAEDVYFGKRPPDTGSPQVVVFPGPTAPAAKEPDLEIRRDYDFAERLGTKKAWEDFLAKHNAGSYADLARDQLAKLEPAATPPSPPPPAPPPAPKPEQEAKADIKVDPIEPPKDPFIRELDRVIEQNPDDGDAYFKRGLAYAQKNRFGEAIKDFDQVIRLNPKDPEALNNRCWARAMVGDLQVALKDCNESLRLKPNFVDALDSRGLVNLKIGQAGKAIADYSAALRVNPRHASALYGRGKAKLRSGDRTGGNADIAAAKAINKDIAQEFEDYGIK
jgi:regulator of sirC expression with transglutaminase-like and TPR domain